VLHSHHGSVENRERFLQEARLLEKLKHPHILSVTDAGFNEHRFPYLVSDYAPQGSLRNRLRRHGKRPLPLEEALSVLSQIGEGLSYAHQQNIVHRDLKPDNILFDAKGEALLADFGIATALLANNTSMLHSTGIMGTPRYMAPEQFQHKVSRRSDQYALGCIAYELLTGRPPFVENDFFTLIVKHSSEQPPDPTQFNALLPTHVVQALLRALEKEREKRYPDILSFIQALSKPVEPKSSEMWIQEALVHQEDGRYTQSLEAYEQALRVSPTLAPAYGGKALALYSLGRYSESLEAIEHALHLASQNATFHFGKGLILESLQRYAEALRFYRQAIQLEPNYAQARQKSEELLRKVQTG
jgi:serine/threonine protein kinase